MSSFRYKMIFFSPVANTAAILAHLFRSLPDALGNIGSNYEQCAFVSAPGTGQFLPTAGATPHIGQVDKLEYVPENRVEVMVTGGAENVREAIRQLKKVHPYEEVAYDVVKLEDF